MEVVIRNFRNKNLQRLYLTGDTRGIMPGHVDRILARLERMDSIEDRSELPSEWRCHPLSGDRQGFYAIKLSGPWRLVFRFEDDEFCDVDYVQYH